MTLPIIRKRIEEFYDGWVAGDFEPAVLQSKDIEVGIKQFQAGDSEPEHFQKIASEVTIVLRGTCFLAGEKLNSGDILVIPPKVSAGFLAETDVLLLVLKSPSIPGDKVLGRVSGTYE